MPCVPRSHLASPSEVPASWAGAAACLGGSWAPSWAALCSVLEGASYLTTHTHTTESQIVNRLSGDASNPSVLSECHTVVTRGPGGRRQRQAKTEERPLSRRDLLGLLHIASRHGEDGLKASVWLLSFSIRSKLSPGPVSPGGRGSDWERPRCIYSSPD